MRVPAFGRDCLACLALALAPAHLNGADREAPTIVAELGLEEGAQRADARPGWARPERIIVRDRELPGVDRLEEAAPGVQLIVARTHDEAVARAGGADAVIGWCTGELLAAGPRIRWIQTLNAGVENCVSIPALRERNVLLTNMQRAQSPVIAEHAIALMLALSRGLDMASSLQARGEWNDRPFEGERLRVLRGKTLLVAGLGGIGTEVARRAHALGMRVIATRASDRSRPEFVSHVGLADELPSLVPQADVIVDSLPLTDATRGLFDSRLFASMKRSAFFINVGRGGTVVTAALVDALRDGKIAGAGLDVTDPEPLPRDHALWRTPNVIITPHVSSSSDLGSETTWQIARENLRRYVAGERMLSVVDLQRGY
ncbi:MAG: D-2-hydroxyacid dehydrogenase [Gammaproteobacteria bacterium]